MPRTEESTVVTHPITGQVMVVQCITDGSFRLCMKHDGSKARWGMFNNFTGGKSGTRMQIKKDAS